jgi:hypothetical protein
MTRARLRFVSGDPLEFDLDDVVAYGPDIEGLRPWLGAVYASPIGQWVIRFDDDRVLGFRRDELKKVRVTPQGISLVLGANEDAVDVPEDQVRSYGPEPEGASRSVADPMSRSSVDNACCAARRSDRAWTR